MKKYMIMTDSAADLSELEAKQLDLRVVRLPLSVNEHSYKEEVDITQSQLIQEMKNKAVVKTAQPVVGELLQQWEEALTVAERILYIPLSSKLSGSFSSASALAAQYDDRIVVVDAKLVAYPLQYICKEARKQLENGHSLEEVKEMIEHNTYMYAALIPDNLDYLRRGGRISSAAAALGNLLKITPILKVEDGGIDVLDKVRTQKKAIQVALESVTDVENHDEYHWYVVEADARELADTVAGQLQDIVQQNITVRPIFPIIMAHTGPGTIGLGRVKKF